MAKAITLLGGFQIDDNGQALTGFQSDKARALLAYLAVEVDRPHQRAQLAGIFWPEWPDQTALTYLRHALANLRKVLGDNNVTEPLLLVTRTTIQFNQKSGYQLDVALIIRSLRALMAPLPDLAQLQQAVAHYQHPFLDGFYLDGCAAFEEWTLATRERLQRQIVEALCHLADHFEEQGDYQQARHYAQRRVDLEPWLEEAHRQLMRLYARDGQRSAALAHYERCRRQLTAELGIEPSEETKALYAAIRGGQFDKMTERQGFAVSAGGVPGANSNQVTQTASVTPSPKHNLPAPTTPLLGRTKDLAVVQTLLQREDVRLVTLTGPGGVGKTRLGLAVAMQLLDAFVDGVFVTFLAPMREPTLVIAAIAQTLAISETGSRPLFERLVAALRERTLLLVFDNFEHLLTAATVVSDLLSACPRLKVLVTSRERLRLQGEYEYITPPLPAPSHGATFTPATVAAWPAVELFCQRALAARHDFALTSENAMVIAAICARLDGLPLAIELAAARSKLFSPQVMLTRLTHLNGDSPLHFLKTDIRTIESRHRSLWETIGWSYTLLTPDEQRFFRRLAVFVGGFTPEDVAAVCCETGSLTLDALEGLASSVDKNLLQVQQIDHELRFTMLETIREFGLAQLAVNQELEQIRQQHANYFAKFVASWTSHLISASSAHAVLQIRAAYSNIRAAFHWLLMQQERAACLQLGFELSYFWTITDTFKEAETYLQAALQVAAGSPPSPAYVNTLASAGLTAFMRGQDELAYRYFTQCLAMNDEIDNCGSPKKIGVAHGLLAWMSFDRGGYSVANHHFAAAQANDLVAGDEWALAMTLANWGRMAARLGDFVQAETLLQEALFHHRRVGQPWGIALTLENQGFLHILQHRFTEATSVLTECQAICIEKRLAIPKHVLGMLAIENGDYAKARSLLTDALCYEQDLSTLHNLLPVLETVAQLVVKQTQFSTALTLAGAICAQRQQLKLVMPPVEKQLFDKAVATARWQLNENAVVAAWTKGEAMTLDEAVAYALSTVG